MSHRLELFETGVPLEKASMAAILIHGRGATAQGIVALRDHLPLSGFYLAAPQATNFTWYPFSFLSPVEENEPWLSSAIAVLHETVAKIEHAGISREKIFIIGFSQGACLSLEYAARNASRYGGVVAFTGGLIGKTIDQSKYEGDFGGTRIYMTNGDADPHVPLGRSEESRGLLKQMGAEVKLEVFGSRPHTILPAELVAATEFAF